MGLTCKYLRLYNAGYWANTPKRPYPTIAATRIFWAVLWWKTPVYV